MDDPMDVMRVESMDVRSVDLMVVNLVAEKVEKKVAM